MTRYAVFLAAVLWLYPGLRYYAALIGIVALCLAVLMSVGMRRISEHVVRPAREVTDRQTTSLIVVAVVIGLLSVVSHFVVLYTPLVFSLAIPALVLVMAALARAVNGDKRLLCVIVAAAVATGFSMWAAW